jgi:hypothetical protein
VTRLHGCHNRPEGKPTLSAQDGWVEYLIGGITSRLPRMVEIPDPMSKDCKHVQLTPDDPSCAGCRWQAVAQ